MGVATGRDELEVTVNHFDSSWRARRTHLDPVADGPSWFRDIPDSSLRSSFSAGFNNGMHDASFDWNIAENARRGPRRRRRAHEWASTVTALPC
jgi:hypothetical protein